MNQEMQSTKMSGKKPAIGTQAYLDIAEIKESTIIMKDGSMRSIIVVSSTNFTLKSNDEQMALISSYQSFLNSLDFPVQILMQSRRLDVHSYLDKLKAIMQQQTNELLRLQTQEYIEYVSRLIEFASIMNKTFYIIVPYTSGVTNIGFLQKITNLINPVAPITLKEQEFQKNREELNNRVHHIVGTLGGMSLRTIILNTEELIELVYNSYNFDAASPIKIKSIEDLVIS